MTLPTPASADSRASSPDRRVPPARPAAVLLGAMAVLGALTGVLWAAWSPARPPGLVVPGGTETAETEQWVAADGRFAVLSIVLGVLFALLAWRARRTRGAVAVLCLAVGGIVGALLTDLVGRLLGGGSSGGPVGTRHAQLPLVLHMHGLLFLEALVAVLLYGVLVGFTAEDDLGRPDPWRAPAAASVGPGGELHGGREDSHAAGGTQQPQLPPQ